MNTSYELTSDDLAALIEFHNRSSPVVRNQKIGCFVFFLAALLVLPIAILLTTEEPVLETAKDIWPLLLGPILYAVFAIPFINWRTRQMSRRMLNEGKNDGFYGQCELSIDDDGLTETRPSGSTIRNWTSVERIVTTPQHLFVYTGGMEAYVVPRRAFQTESEFDEFADAITKHTAVSFETFGRSNPLPKASEP